MKKFVLAATSVLVATMSLAGSALADGRNRGDDEWRRDGQQSEYRDRDNDNGNWDGDRRRHDRHDDDDWRRDHWRHHHGWRNDGWRDGPRVIIRPDFERYCFIKKVRRYDDWGNLYIKRIRVCR